ncbi:MAG: endonuclease/exonuclease/phosphatase family protein [Flavobacteriaceae bacterium]|nr:endonuclease/exonuclease/phosphatase family protein [Flavobacteriaceae bacterium]
MKTKNLLLLLLVVSMGINLNAQNKKRYKINTVAFYNLENLFDTINDPNKLDERSPLMEMSAKERGLVYPKKIKNMARVISELGVDPKYSRNAPVILGVCEVENKDVLHDLINDPQLRGNDYDIIHFDSPDERSIDVALLYQKKLFKPTNYSKHELILYDPNTEKRNYTRDQLLVSGLLEGEKMHFIVNHWPSRSGGEARSRPGRISAAKLTKKLVDSLQTIDPYAKIIIMGDFNDDPFNVSIKKILNAKAEKEDVELRGIYNPMMKMTKKGMGTLAYRDALNIFDQLMFTKPFLDKDFSTFKIYKTGIYNPAYMTNKKGRYKGYPKRSFVGATWTGGYSDHFPVYTYLIKEVK